MKQRMIAAFLAAALLLSPLPHTKAQPIDVYETFTAYTGGAPASWAATGAAQMEKIVVDSAHGNSIRFNTTDTVTDVNITRQLPQAAEGKFTFSISVYPYTTTHKRPIFFFRDSAGAENFFITFNDKGKIVAHTDGNQGERELMSYQANTWYDISGEMDTTAKTYTLTINDTSFGVLQFSRQDITNIKSFKISQWGKNGACVFDDIVFAAYQDTFDKLRARMVFLTTGPQDADRSDPQVRSVLQKMGNDAATYRKSLNRDTARTYLWSDANDFSASATISLNFDRINKFAMAYATPGTSLYLDQGLLEDALSALEWMYQYKYNETIEEYDNWWEWDIGSPKLITNILALLYDETPEQLREGLLRAIDHYVPDVPETDGGANRAWRSAVLVQRGILGKNEQKIRQGMQAMQPLFAYAETGDGFYADGSFLQHDKVPYTMGYGKSLLEILAQSLYVVSGSPYDVSAQEYDMICAWVEDAFAPLMFRGSAMSMTSGREIARDYSEHVIGHKVLNAVLMLSQSVPDDRRPALASFIKGMLQSDSYQTFDGDGKIPGIVWSQRLLENPECVPAVQTPMYHQFARMDRAVAHRSGYAFGLSMSSERIYNYESINGENLKGFYTGDGMTYLYNSHLGHYSDNYWNTVDFYRLPGTTVQVGNRPNSDQAGKSPNTSFVGGASTGLYGVSGMELAPVGLALRGKKSWFVFDDEIVCLGSGITDTSNKQVETIVENRMLSNDGDNLLVIDGVETPVQTGTDMVYGDTHWANLHGEAGGNIGYYFPGSVDLHVRREARSGSWSDINTGGATKKVTRQYAQLFLQHGVNPSGQQYAYVMLPDKQDVQMAQYAASPDIQIIANTDRVHMVQDTALGITAANFWTDQTTTAGALTVDKKASVILCETEDAYQIYVSDPTQRNQEGIHVTLAVETANGTVPMTVYIDTAGTNGATQCIVLDKKIMVQNVYLSQTPGGAPIDDITRCETVYVNADVINLTGQPAELMLTAAAYGDKRLLAAVQQDQWIKGSVTLCAEVPIHNGTIAIDVLLWEGNTTLRPMKDKVRIYGTDS